MVFRIIPRLDIKPPYLVKGINLEGVRKLGDPSEFAAKYYLQGADELFYQDVVASLYGRKSFLQLIHHTAEEIFVPLTVGGGLRSLDDIQNVLRHGADKVCINTSAVENHNFISEAAERFGSQCIVAALEVIRKRDGREGWEPLVNNGREHTGLDAEEWAQQVVALGAGELLITSIEQEGTRKGFDFEFIDKIKQKISVPIILHGGAGSVSDIVNAAQKGMSGVAISSILHYEVANIMEIKSTLEKEDIEVRK